MGFTNSSTLFRRDDCVFTYVTLRKHGGKLIMEQVRINSDPDINHTYTILAGKDNERIYKNVPHEKLYILP